MSSMRNIDKYRATLGKIEKDRYSTGTRKDGNWSYVIVYTDGSMTVWFEDKTPGDPTRHLAHEGEVA